jgi:hypothetical protein
MRLLLQGHINKNLAPSHSNPSSWPAKSDSPTTHAAQCAAGAGAGAGAVDVMTGARCEPAGLRLLVFRGIWTSLFCLGIVLVLQRAGDEFRGVGDVGLGLEARDELARNLSRKCCSQSAEGMAMVWFGFGWWRCRLGW